MPEWTPGRSLRPDWPPLRHEYGFDKPILVQYADYLGRAVRGDFGDSVSTGRPVSSTSGGRPAADNPADRLPRSSSPCSSAADWRWWRPTPHADGCVSLLLSLPPLGVSVPTFWVGAAARSRRSPSACTGSPRSATTGFGELILPALTLAIPTGAQVAQVLAKSLLTALDQAYVETARAKGAGRWWVHLRHALRNASLPALTPWSACWWGS
ncbi:ABC transporter permease [Streptomyces sp. L7]